MLDSPHFLYRTELGTRADDSAELRLTDYALASQLSYFLTVAPPDDALLQAAARGELADAEQLDANLAAFYGISFPPPGAHPDADGFVSTLLPETRAGLLMRSGTSVISARPDGTSVVQRGLWVSMHLLCAQHQPETQRPDTFEPIPQGSQRELALQRLSDPDCRSCHLDIDPYGLALEDLDAVGRFRSEDADGHPIDASATLPALAGGAKVQSSLELSSALPSAALALCFSQRFLDHALSLAARSEPKPGCVAQALATERADTATFSEILRQIVSSPSFSQRRRD